MTRDLFVSSIVLDRYFSYIKHIESKEKKNPRLIHFGLFLRYENKKKEKGRITPIENKNKRSFNVVVVVVEALISVKVVQNLDYYSDNIVVVDKHFDNTSLYCMNSIDSIVDFENIVDCCRMLTTMMMTRMKYCYYYSVLHFPSMLEYVERDRSHLRCTMNNYYSDYFVEEDNDHRTHRCYYNVGLNYSNNSM